MSYVDPDGLVDKAADASHEAYAWSLVREWVAKAAAAPQANSLDEEAAGLAMALVQTRYRVAKGKAEDAIRALHAAGVFSLGTGA